MNTPKDLKYSKEHEWMRLSEDRSTATIGITNFAQGELGDIVFVEFEDDGSELGKDEIFGTIEAVKTVSELYMPVAGTLLEINENLDANPELVNDSPYEEGWMVKISIANADEVDALMDADAYAEMTGSDD